MFAVASARRPAIQLCKRAIGTSSARPLPSAAYTNASLSTPGDPSTSSTPELTNKQRSALDAALRIDQAGEIAANYIYQGQFAVLGKDPTTRHLIQVRIPISQVLNGNCSHGDIGNVGPREETFGRYE